MNERMLPLLHAAGGPAASSAASGKFVTRNGTHFELEGQPFRFLGEW